jgi:hypothetical protein
MGTEAGNRRRRRKFIQLKPEFTNPVSIGVGNFRREFIPSESYGMTPAKARIYLKSGLLEVVGGEEIISSGGPSGGGQTSP